MVLRNKKSRLEHIEISGYFTIFLFLFLVIIDKITKIWALTLDKEIDNGIFAFTLAFNTGAGFSILKGNNSLLIWVAIIALGAIIYFKEYFPRIGFALISAGIIGNLLDRIMYGYVIDFINFRFWPIFNAADIFIFFGVMLTATQWWITDRKIKSSTAKKFIRRKSINDIRNQKNIAASKSALSSKDVIKSKVYKSAKKKK